MLRFVALCCVVLCCVVLCCVVLCCVVLCCVVLCCVGSHYYYYYDLTIFFKPYTGEIEVKLSVDNSTVGSVFLSYPLNVTGIS